MTTVDFKKRESLNELIIEGLCGALPGFTSKPLCLTLPGGVEICPQPSMLHIGLLDYAAMALHGANMALAPLTPVFRIIDVIMAIHKCLMAIPGILGPPPDPTLLIEALQELGEKVKAIIRMLPYLTVPILLLQMIDITIAVLRGTVVELEALARYVETIESAELSVADAPGLQPMITCAWAHVNAQMDNLKYIVAPLNPTIELLNLFAQIAQIGDPFPIARIEAFPESPQSPRIIADNLKIIIENMSAVREVIPF